MARAQRDRNGVVTLIEPTCVWDDLDAGDTATRAMHQLVRSIGGPTDHAAVRAASTPARGRVLLLTGRDRQQRCLAGQAIAHAMGRALLHVDLGAVDSRWVAETEAHLNQVFEKADDLDAVLLIDEGDDLFGRRTSITDAHDRFSNEQVNYLLNKLEDLVGLCILSSNARSKRDFALPVSRITRIHLPRRKGG